MYQVADRVKVTDQIGLSDRQWTGRIVDVLETPERYVVEPDVPDVTASIRDAADVEVIEEDNRGLPAGNEGLAAGRPLSLKARKAKREAAMRRRAHQALGRRRRRAMQLGPRREGHWLVIPSKPNWYNPGAKDFWKSLGARFHKGDPESHVWILDTKEARYEGKRYTPGAWLRSVRRKYYEFYEGLEASDA